MLSYVIKKTVQILIKKITHMFGGIISREYHLKIFLVLFLRLYTVILNVKNIYLRASQLNDAIYQYPTFV